MGKRQKKAGPVTLSNQELIPSVIGVIDNKEKSTWPLVMLFGLLIAFIIGLPRITAYISGESNVIDTTSPSETKEKNPNETSSEETKFYSFTNDLSIALDGLVVRNFQFQANDLSLYISNESADKDYLVNHALFLELYDKNNTLLQRIKMPNESINQGASQTYTFDSDVSVNLISQVVLEEKQTKDYPSVHLTKENDNTYSLTCNKGTEKIVYRFDSEQKLEYLTQTINVTSSSLYQQELTDYRQMTSKYNAINGVTSNIVEVGGGFTVTTNIDLDIVDFNNRTTKNTLDDKVYYGKGTEGKVVYFELSAMNYKCTM